MTTYISHRRAKFDFEILDSYEAGVVLSGTEVKSIRNGQGKLEGSHVIVRGAEAFLVGASISAYQKANAPKEYDPEKARKLLLSAKEIEEISQKVDKEGLTAVPLKWYSSGSKIKLEVAIARGKKKTDKRQSIKARDTKRDIERELKFK